MLEVIGSGEIIERYQDDKPFPSALILGWDEGGPLHVVVAYDAESGYCMIITVYRPDLEHFEQDFRTRRRDG